ncbi:asparaginase domain-containing protein [Moraxella sp. RCAD0137]|uniref:asparaginase domain-containing protein n=1 Tax=Moraxella sp. RCAD0137 TaxID=1775913 RepID=UPI001D0D055D|nr:asparaginase domain-containing protein [Moraxella sp. RCAD0137]
MTTPIHLIYAGGTFGSHGTPLSPLPADVFLPILTERLAEKQYAITVLDNDVVKDSSTLTPTEFVHFYQLILASYTTGVRRFVLLTGTDTLSFLAAFLAHALADFNDISLVITGSMQPLFVADSADYQINPHSDAWANLSGALDVAMAQTGVFVQFYHQTLDAKNTQKINSQIHDAFVGVPAAISPAVIDGTDQAVLDHHLSHLPTIIKQAAQTRIHAIYALPNDPDYLVESLQTLHVDVKAVILIGYGSGNLPSSPAIIRAIDDAIARGVRIICTTMCPFGGVSSTYAAGAWQYAHGVISGGNLSIAAIYGQALWLSLNNQLTAEHWTIAP